MRVWTMLLILVFFVGVGLLVYNLILLVRKLVRRPGAQVADFASDYASSGNGVSGANKKSGQNPAAQPSKYVAIVAVIMIVVSLGILLYMGKPQSLVLSTQLPSQFDRTSVILTDDLDLVGTKAITLNDAGDSDGLLDSFLFFTDALFRYSHEYLPDDMRANSVDEIGYIVVAKHELDNVGTYSNGGKALQHNITVSIFEGHKVLAENTFKGDGAPASRGGSGDWRGNPPDSKVIEEWVTEELRKL